MIAAEQDPDLKHFRWHLRPNRALRLEGFLVVFLTLALLAMAVAAFSAWQGNVFAPVFAVLHLLLVGFGLAAAWRAGNRSESIELDEEMLCVRAEGRGESRELARFHPFWVRLLTPDEIPGERCRLILRSHGRSLEFGRFLGAAERRELATMLRSALNDLKA